MIFTASDVSSLATSLGRWEWAEYGSCALVALGCTGEYIAEFTDCWTGGIKEKKDRLAKRSTLLLISALALELVCLVKTNSISGMLIGSLSDKAEKADAKAQSAIDKSSLAEHKADAANTNSSTAVSQATDALTKAGKAAESLGKAEDEANKAQAASSNALTLARGARLEADSFEQDIRSAKKQAAEAESHLAEAHKEASDAQAGLNSLKTPRSLTNVTTLVSALEPFKATEFGFLGLFGDQESIDLAQKISDALQSAGWKPTNAPNTGHGSSFIRLKNFPAGITPTMSTGIQIEVESEEKVETLRTLPPSKWPQQVQAAAALKAALAFSVSPSQDDLASSDLAVIPAGKFSTVLIVVGKKM